MTALLDDSAFAEYITEAVTELQQEAGASPGRAKQVLEAAVRAAGVEGLAIVAGRDAVTASMADARLKRLRRILQALPVGAEPLSVYEVAVLFQVTGPQARTLLRNYQARYATDYRNFMAARVKAVAAKTKSKGVPGSLTFPFDDSATLEYAMERLRRGGYERTLNVDRSKLTVSVASSVKVGNKNAKSYLNS